MTTPTDTQLKRCLAKILPEKVKFDSTEDEGEDLRWRNMWRTRVSDTELLHVCWLIERTLQSNQLEEYSDALASTDSGVRDYAIESSICHWSWQSRTIALAKVKNVEVV